MVVIFLHSWHRTAQTFPQEMGALRHGLWVTRTCTHCTVTVATSIVGHDEQRYVWRHAQYAGHSDRTNRYEEATERILNLNLNTYTLNGTNNLNTEAGMFFTIRKFFGPMGFIC